MSGILRALNNGHHNVTVFTPFIDGNHEDYTDVDTSERAMKFLDTDIKDVRVNTHTIMGSLVELNRMRCGLVYKNNNNNNIIYFVIKGLQ